MISGELRAVRVLGGPGKGLSALESLSNSSFLKSISFS